MNRAPMSAVIEKLDGVNIRVYAGGQQYPGVMGTDFTFQRNTNQSVLNYKNTAYICLRQVQLIVNVDEEGK